MQGQSPAQSLCIVLMSGRENFSVMFLGRVIPKNVFCLGNKMAAICYLLTGRAKHHWT